MILIPSYQRADYMYEKGGTLRYCKGVENVFLAVRKEEEKAYQRAADKYGCKLLVLSGLEGKGVKETRQKLLDIADDRTLMIDDDQTIKIKDGDKLFDLPENGMELVFDTLNDLSDKYEDSGVWGIPYKFFHKGIKDPIMFNVFIAQVLFIRKDRVSSMVRFDALKNPFAEGIDFLVLTRKDGLGVHKYNGFVHYSNNFAKGGCSHERTIETHNASLKEVARKHPNHVKVFYKFDKKLGAQRLYTRIYLKEMK